MKTKLTILALSSIIALLVFPGCGDGGGGGSDEYYPSYEDNSSVSFSAFRTDNMSSSSTDSEFRQYERNKREQEEDN